MSDQAPHKKESAIFLKGIGWNTAGIVFRFLRFAYHILFARMLGASSFGQYILFYSIIEAISKISTLGLEYGTIKFLQNQKARNTQVNMYHAVLVISLVAFALTLVVAAFSFGVFYGLFHQSPRMSGLVLYAMLVVPLGMLNFLSIVSRATLDMRYENILRNFVETGGILVFGYFFLRMDSSVFSLLKAHISASALAIILYVLLFSRLAQRSNLIVSWGNLFRESYVMGLVAFVNFTRAKVDYFLLGKFLTFSQLAVYSMAVQIISLIAKINSVMAPIAGPLIHTIFIENNQNKLQNNLRHMLQYSIRAIFIGGLILVFFYQDILILYGKSFVLDRNVFSVLLVAQMVFIFFGIPEQYLLFTKHQKTLLRLSTGLILMLAVSFTVVVPIYELMGAVWCILGSYALYGLAIVWQLRKKLQLHLFDDATMKNLLFFVSVFVLTILVSRWLDLNRFIAVPLSLAVYGVWIYAHWGRNEPRKE